MPVPKRKTSRARRDSRDASKHLTAQPVGQCDHCKEPAIPHQVCKACGYYKGVKVMTTKQDRDKTRKKESKQKKGTTESDNQSTQ